MARTRQPQGAVRVDWNNPLARGLRAAIIPHLGIDLVTGRMQQSGQTANSAMPYGMARNFSAGGASYGHHANYAVVGQLTIAALYRASTADYGGIIAAKQGATTAWANFEWRGCYGGGDQKPYYTIRDGSGYASEWVTTNTVPALFTTGGFISLSVGDSVTCYFNGVEQPLTNTRNEIAAGSDDGTSALRIGDRVDGVVKQTGEHGLLLLWNRGLSAAEQVALAINPWSLFAGPRRLWIQLGAASGGAGTDAAIAGTQDSDVGAITAEATTAAAIAGTQDADVGAIAAEATTGAAIAGAQAPDVGAITAEATTGAAIVGTQDSDVAALEVTAGTGSTDAAMAGTQAPDVGAITVEATLGLTLSATQASDVGYIVVEATLPASMAGTQDSDVAAITVTAAGTSIWTDISGSTTSWADQSAASTIWTDL